MTTEEREELRLAREDERAKLRGHRQGRKWLKALALAVPFLLFTIAFAVVVFIMFGTESQNVDQTDARAAKTVLTHAVDAAEAFAATHNNSFAAVTTYSLKKLEPRIEWVNSSPANGQVSIKATRERTFTCVYKNMSGAQFKAERNEDGVVKYTDSRGYPI